MIPTLPAERYQSGYRLMWLVVLFDLPVVETKDRKAAAGFRNFLLDRGYSMAQFSVYMRLMSGKEAAETAIAKIERHLPGKGTVQVLTITDRQYENLRTFRSRTRREMKNPDQFLLF